MPDLQPIPVVRGERPRRRGNRKLLLFLFVFFITLLGILFFQSSFSKIHRIDVEGQRLLTAEQVVEAADIAEGDHFFAVSGGTISQRVEQLSAVEEAQTIKRFPGLIRIEVKEYPVVALELLNNGDLAGLLSNGTSVPYGNVEQSASKPILTGWEDERQKAELCLALAGIAPQLLQDISEIRPSPSGSYADRIIMYTRSQYEVVTRISYLADKLPLLDEYVYELKLDRTTIGRIVLLETNYAEPFETAPSGTE